MPWASPCLLPFILLSKVVSLRIQDATLDLPASPNAPETLGKTTHLGIGAHADDLEFMALDGILACYRQPGRWFSGITVTDGAGSARSGAFANHTNEEMVLVRKEEQRNAAKLGEYLGMIQLGLASKHLSDASLREDLVHDLAGLIREASPEVLYTHNPFDRHPTHRRVLEAVAAALVILNPEERPRRWIGCEVWRDLDWLPDRWKVVMDVSANPELAKQLNGCYVSQIEGGKRYDLAVEGRRRAHATFGHSHETDGATQVIYGVELSSLLIKGPSRLHDFCKEVLEKFQKEILQGLAGD